MFNVAWHVLKLLVVWKFWWKFGSKLPTLCDLTRLETTCGDTLRCTLVIRLQVRHELFYPSFLSLFGIERSNQGKIERGPDWSYNSIHHISQHHTIYHYLWHFPILTTIGRERQIIDLFYSTTILLLLTGWWVSWLVGELAGARTEPSKIE